MMARTPLKNLKNIYTVSAKFLSFGSRLFSYTSDIVIHKRLPEVPQWQQVVQYLQQMMELLIHLRFQRKSLMRV